MPLSSRTKARQKVLAHCFSDLDLSDIATAFGMTLGALRKLSSRTGLRMPQPSKQKEVRNDEMVDLYRSGFTLEEVGAKFGVGRERVRQVISKRGVSKKDGGAFVGAIERAKQAESERREQKNNRFLNIYGCSFKLALELNEGAKFATGGSRARCFVQQRRTALHRGIQWEMTFPEWVRLWDESGHWSERCRGGYCMARIGDTGPYKAGNVAIITFSQNSKDGYLVVSAQERQAKRETRSWRATDPLWMTPRQQQVADLIRQGKNVTEIALLLSIKRRNAWHVANNVKKKLALAAQSQGRETHAVL